MLPAGTLSPAPTRVLATRPMHGSETAHEAFADALARKKRAHTEEATRIATLQCRRENVLHARSILNAVYDTASRQIDSIEAARDVLLLCVDLAVCEVETFLAKSAAQRYHLLRMRQSHGLRELCD